MVDLEALRSAFVAKHAAVPRIFWAPGRVNLIGEHTDYNDGFVMPIALGLGTAVAAAPRSDRRVHAHSLHFGETREFDLDDRAGPLAPGGWIAYVEGVARTLGQRGASLGGADLMIASDLPVGAGLSSSASLGIAAGLAFASLSAASGGAVAPIDALELALAGQEAEHHAAGVPCGIMDPYAAVFAKAGRALLLDCRALEAAHVPIDSRRAAFVVCHSGVERRLASSAYAERRAECRRAVEILREAVPGIRALRDVDAETFERVAHHLPEPIRRRCRHVVSEIARTLDAAESLRGGDFARTGRLMLGSHASLRDDYEVSVPELDRLVEAACSVSGVFGARLTGGGFGGCTVSLVAPEALAEFAERMPRLYAAAAPGRPLAMHTTAPGGGAREIAG